MPARAEEYLEVVSGEFLRPSRLSPVQHLRCLEELQVLVVRDDLDLVFCSFQISSPSLEAVDYCEKFFVRSVVVDFCLCKFSRMEGDRV